jgi:hypothetical protein
LPPERITGVSRAAPLDGANGLIRFAFAPHYRIAHLERQKRGWGTPFLQRDTGFKNARFAGLLRHKNGIGRKKCAPQHGFTLLAELRFIYAHPLPQGDFQ